MCYERKHIFRTAKNRFLQQAAIFRNQRGISAREMSLSLGQNVNYINLIENGKRVPSMEGFFFICEFFGVTPEMFFSAEGQNICQKEVVSQQKILAVFEKLDNGQRSLILDFINSFCHK